MEALQLHHTEYAFALKLLFEGFQRLIDVVFTNDNLHLGVNSYNRAA
jgi:hypothetical protein